MAVETSAARPARHRPRTATVFMAAFVAGAVAAVGVNRALDLRLAQAKPQVECEPVFVALRALPAGVPVTVWDVALRDLPKAMVPATALRVTDSFEGRLLKFPLREGQPLLSAQLAPPEVATPVAPETPVAPPSGQETIQETIVEEAFVAPLPAPPVAAESPVPGSESTDTATAIPEREQAAPRVAAAEPHTATATEPTPAPPQPVEPARPVTAAPETIAGPTADGRLASDLDATLDMPSRPAMDLADLPSVMASGDSAAAAADGGEGSGVRYLVVPERIARQADTSFTTPTAPEGGEPAQAATRRDRGPAAAPHAETTPPTPVPPTAVKQPEPARQVRPSAPRQPQGRSSAAARQQTGPQPAKPRATAGQPTAAVPEPTGPRAWGGMFPNVSAGLDAMGNWRSGSRGGAGQSDRGSTTR